MANSIKEGGLRLVEARVDQSLTTCLHTASERLGIGDAVKTGGSSGQISNGPYTKTVALITSGAPIYGVVQGVLREFVASGMNLDIRHAASAVSTYVLVRRANPFDVYAISEDGTTAAADVGQCADLTGNGGGTTITECNSTTGMSTLMLDTSTSAASTGQLKIQGFEDVPNNTPVSVNASLLVTINECEDVGAGQNGI
jgi:hypothetical protein